MDVNGLINYGAIGIVLAYFIWKDNATMKDFRTSLESLKDMIQMIKTEMDMKNKQ